MCLGWNDLSKKMRAILDKDQYGFRSCQTCDICNNYQLSAAWFYCDNIIPYHQTIMAELTII